MKTNESFNQMRLAMEKYIQSVGNIKIINTTKGGAAIQGAPFTPLEEIIESKLQTNVVDPNWYVSEETSNHYALERKKQFLKEMEDFVPSYEQVLKVLRELQQQIEKKNVKKIEDCFTKFDKQFHKFINQPFYLTIIQPMVRIQFEKLQNDISQLNKIINTIEKAQHLITASGLYLLATKQVFNELSPFVYEVLNETDEYYKKYKNDCGVFSYSEEWKKETIKIDGDKGNSSLTYHAVDKKGAKVKFNFIGTSLQILAGTRKDFAEKIEVKLDGKTTTISTKSSRTADFIFEKDQPVFVKSNLANELHEVEITLLEDKPIVFNGVKVNKEGRACHIHEVNTVEELEIGKRIRCHYKATYDEVGEFSGLGEETSDFIPPESSAFPDGDFYFIMVDETEEEGKKLIADRNVQHTISHKEIMNGLNNYKGKINGKLSLISGGGSEGELNNDWDKYIVNSHANWHADIGISSWTSTPAAGEENKFIRRGSLAITSFINNEFCFSHIKDTSIGFRPLLTVLEL